MSLGKIEVIAFIVLFIVLLLVGGKKLPELARSFGESARELKKGFQGEGVSTDSKGGKDGKKTAKK